MFDAAIEAALPRHVVAKHLPEPPGGRTIVIGAGKASAAMAKALEEAWDGPLEGLVVTRYAHAVACEQIEIVEGRSSGAGRSGTTGRRPDHDDGEGSGCRRSCDCVDLRRRIVAPGVCRRRASPWTTSKQINRALLKSGAVHRSDERRPQTFVRHQGGAGWPLPAFPARLVTLAISDVPGDDPSIIASGPTVADPVEPGGCQSDPGSAWHRSPAPGGGGSGGIRLTKRPSPVITGWRKRR